MLQFKLQNSTANSITIPVDGRRVHNSLRWVLATEATYEVFLATGLFALKRICWSDPVNAKTAYRYDKNLISKRRGADNRLRDGYHHSSAEVRHHWAVSHGATNNTLSCA